MMKKEELPKDDGFYMPAEFSAHEGTLIIWPVRPGSWGVDPFYAQETFLQLIRQISKSEKVYILAAEQQKKVISKAIREKGLDQTFIMVIESDDAWARDVCPTFLTNGISVKGINWKFNAWGGNVDGLYASWDRDDAVAEQVCEQLKMSCYSAGEFILEGGSIHSDGEGTIMTTESCLLSKGRNTNLTKGQIEEKLMDYLGAKKVLWLPRGIYLDETNEHVDNICAFVSPGEVVLAWTDNQEDEQYLLSKACLDYLDNQRDAKGRKLIIHKLPIPDVPVRVRNEELCRYQFEDGEEIREAGERLAASYVNFYFTNDAVIVPQFGGENKESDRRALEIIEQICPNRRVIGIDSYIILMGGGNIHCITQQIPAKGEIR